MRVGEYAHESRWLGKAKRISGKKDMMVRRVGIGNSDENAVTQERHRRLPKAFTRYRVYVGTWLSYAMPASVCAASTPIRGPGAMQGHSGTSKCSYSCAGQISAFEP